MAEHLGGHEVSKVVQPELAGRLLGGVVGGFGDPVRFPCAGAVVVAEHLPVPVIVGKVGEKGVGVGVEVDASFGLGGGQHGTSGPSTQPAQNEIRIVSW